MKKIATQEDLTAFRADLDFFTQTFSVTSADLDYCRNVTRMKLNDGMHTFDNPVFQFYMRTFLRSLMSSFECITYLSKQLLLSLNRHFEIPLSDDDLHFINETRKKKDTGEIVKQNIELKDNFKGIFKIFNKIFGDSIELDCNAKEYSILLETIQIRHNLTHPKHYDSLIITPDNFDKITNTYVYYGQIFRYLYDKIKEGLTAMNIRIDS